MVWSTDHHPNGVHLSSSTQFYTFINDHIHEGIKSTQDALNMTATVELNCKCAWKQQIYRRNAQRGSFNRELSVPTSTRYGYLFAFEITITYCWIEICRLYFGGFQISYTLIFLDNILWENPALYSRESFLSINLKAKNKTGTVLLDQTLKHNSYECVTRMKSTACGISA